MIKEAQWLVLDEFGADALNVTSFIDIDVANEGQALSYPVEEGGFMNYNKTQTPLNIRVTVAMQGSDDDFKVLVDKLDGFQERAEKIFVLTPSSYYGPLTLASYTYKRSRESGAGQLVAELSLVEIREVKTQVTTTVITKPKNATSSGTVDTGQTQTEAEGESGSILSVIFD